jgi:peptidoglycan/LPS O-acetylase OafA/YrhL
MRARSASRTAAQARPLCGGALTCPAGRTGPGATAFMHGKATPLYLPHVDGLRAVAVLSVLFYHYRIAGFPGGYVGVDVFFVISGFLITKIIESEIRDTGKFSYAFFYKRRIRRLFPALIFTLAATSLAAFLLFVPEDFVRYGRSLAAAALSLANFHFWLESGYFDASSETKPLLHTWSLSVEEQFYLFWPALMVLVWKLRSLGARIAAVLAFGALSFLLNHLVVQGGGPGYASTIFFLTPFRGFEFALGALGAMVGDRLTRNALAHEAMTLLGLGLIAYSVATLTKDSVFPYVNALVPCVGTLLVILGRESPWTGALLRNRLMVGIGLISYSLYLAHWPILVFTRYAYFQLDSPARTAWMLAAAFGAAAFMYLFVEKPTRHYPLGSARNLFYAGNVAALLVATAVGASMARSEGWIWRYSLLGPGLLVGGTASTGSAGGPAERGAAAPEQGFRPLTAGEIDAGKSRRFDLLHTTCNLLELNNPKRCFLDRPVQVLVFGNSHEPDAFNMLHHLYGKSAAVNIISFGTVNECDYRVVDGNITAATKALNCDTRFAILNDRRFTDRLRVVVYNSHYGFDGVAAGLWEILEVIAARNSSLRLVAIGSYIETTMDCSSIYNRTGSFDGCRSEELVRYFNPEERARSPIRQVSSLDYLYVSKYDLLCRSGTLASCAVFAGGEPAFYDTHHLSLGFARHLADLIAERHGRDLQALGLPRPDAR